MSVCTSAHLRWVQAAGLTALLQCIMGHVYLSVSGVIMDMFQAPTFLEEPFSNTAALHDAERIRAGGKSGPLLV